MSERVTPNPRYKLRNLRELTLSGDTGVEYSWDHLQTMKVPKLYEDWSDWSIFAGDPDMRAKIRPRITDLCNDAVKTVIKLAATIAV